MSLNTKPMKYKCIIFDCDGVLVDSEAISCKVLTNMVRPLGLDISMDYAIKHFSGKSMSSILDYFKQELGRSLPEDFETAYRKNSFEAYKKEMQPIRGVKDLLSGLKIPFCVASSGPVEKIKLNLEVTGLLPFFTDDRIFSSYAIGSWKPEPGIFLHAAKTMGYSPQECVVIEDSLAGMTAAKAGGFSLYCYVNDKSHNVFENNDVAVFCEMNSLPDLLGL